jgi:hypothetical protein
MRRRSRPSEFASKKRTADAQLLLKLLLENNFPRVWVASPENRDLRQLLWHRHRLVQMCTRIMNQLQALAMVEACHRQNGLLSSNLLSRIGIGLAQFREVRFFRILDVNATLAFHVERFDMGNRNLMYYWS